MKTATTGMGDSKSSTAARIAAATSSDRVASGGMKIAMIASAKSWRASVASASR